jgi:hypothetical protein
MDDNAKDLISVSSTSFPGIKIIRDIFAFSLIMTGPNNLTLAFGQETFGQHDVKSTPLLVNIS